MRTIFIAGEHCDLETKTWIERNFKVPVLNHWWQTESGSPITATCIGFNHNLNPPKFTTGLPCVGYDGKNDLLFYKFKIENFNLCWQLGWLH